jgi:exopolysaccharide production protein ExoQ
MESTTKRMFSACESALGVVSLLFFMGAVLPVLRNPEHWFMDARASDPVALLFQTGMYLVVLLLAASIWRDIFAALRENPLITALLVFTFASVLWSGVPGFSLRRAVTLLVTTIFGIYLGSRYDSKEQIRLLGIALAISVVLSLVFIVAFPRYGIESGPNAGAWRGVFIQKNTYGRYMVMAAITLFCLPTHRMKQLAKILIIILSVCLLAGSLSAGSYVMMIVSAALVIVYQVLRLPRRNLIPIGIFVGIIVAACAVVIVLNAGAIFELLGRNSSLTGRVPLWHFLLYKGQDHPWFGYGYVAFWSTQNQTVWAQIGWTPLKAHNGYLDLWLELGFVGLGLFLLNTALVLGRALKFVTSRHTLQSEWPLLMLSLIILHNFFESDLLIQNGFMWIIYVALSVSLQRALRAEQPAETRVPLVMSESMSGARASG